MKKNKTLTRFWQTFISTFQKSAFKPDYYQDVIKAPFSFSLKYFLFLFFSFGLLTTITFSFYLLKEFNPNLNKLKTAIIKLYPSELEIKINNGQVSTNVNEPYFIPLKPEIFPKEISQALKNQPRQNILVIDTKAHPSDIKKYQTFSLLSKDSLSFQTGNKETRIKSLEEIKNLTLNQEIIKESLDKAVLFLKKIFPFLSISLLIFISLSIFLEKFIYLVFFSLLSWPIAKFFFHKNLGYNKVLQINLQAITLPLIISAIFQILGAGQSIPFFQTTILLIFNLIIFSSLKQSS